MRQSTRNLKQSVRGGSVLGGNRNNAAGMSLRSQTELDPDMSVSLEVKEKTFFEILSELSQNTEFVLCMFSITGEYFVVGAVQYWIPFYLQ